MTLFDFVQWCFRSPLSGFVTFIFACLLAQCLVGIAAALRGGK